MEGDSLDFADSPAAAAATESAQVPSPSETQADAGSAAVKEAGQEVSAVEAGKLKYGNRGVWMNSDYIYV